MSVKHRELSNPALNSASADAQAGEQARYKFDDAHADLILTSAAPECADFRVHRCILAISSTFFEGMFTLPQPLEGDKELPVVHMSESADVIQTLLELVYPLPKRLQLDRIEQISPVLAAASKYSFTGAMSALAEMLLAPKVVESAPVRVFAVLTMYGLEEDAVRASAYTLRQHILDAPLHDDLHSISAHTYHRLLVLHRDRARQAVELIHGSPSDDVVCMQCSGPLYVSGLPILPRWWAHWVDRAAEELKKRPTTELIFSSSFLAEVASGTGCPRCPGSVLLCHHFLDDLKMQIDLLPSTI